MKKNIDFIWHSCMDDVGKSNKKVVNKLSVSQMGGKFLRAHKESDFLIHKATKALWRFSEDGKSIEPVFEEDILTEDKL